MPGGIPLGIDAVVTAAAACSATALGILGLFGGSDDADLNGIARRLDTDEDADQIERQLDDLEDAINTVVANADLDRHVADPPAADASSVEKAQALAQAVEDGRLSVGPASASGPTGSDDAEAIVSAATKLRRDTSPSSPTARKLLDHTATPGRADPADIESVLERAVTNLDARHAVERALSEVDADDLTPRDARRVRDRLSHVDDAIAADVRRLADTSENHDETDTDREVKQERVAAATDALTKAAADADIADIGPDSGRSVGERLRRLADAIERGELAFSDGDGSPVASVAAEMRRSKRPESTVAKRLLDRLSSPEMGDLRAALDTAVEQLDAASTTHSVVADLDPEEVRTLADEVESQFDSTADPTATVLADRVADLREMVDRADESNAVIPYAVRQELRFYDRTLVSQLADGDKGAGSSGGDADLGLDAVLERHEEIEDRYVDGRRDHNHSIPLHFLSLVDSLTEEAEQAATAGDRARAAGLSSAADRTLDHVEQLYERNEYSVMLRRLRG